MKKIELPFVKQKGKLFTMYFVYPKDNQSFVITGDEKEVESYIKSNYPCSIFNRTIYQNGRCVNSFWSSTHTVYIHKSKPENRTLWGVSICGEEYKQLFFRKLPKKWLPEYDLAKIR